MWISFKYEWLSNMCYWCGRLTHNDRDCKLWIDNEGTLTPEQCEFGPYLRAPLFVALGMLREEHTRFVLVDGLP